MTDQASTRVGYAAMACEWARLDRSSAWASRGQVGARWLKPAEPHM